MLTLYIRLSLSEHFHHLGCTQTVGKGQDQVTPSSLLASIVAGRGAVEHRARTVLARNIREFGVGMVMRWSEGNWSMYSV
jgi:hypothetical protein